MKKIKIDEAMDYINKEKYLYTLNTKRKINCINTWLESKTKNNNKFVSIEELVEEMKKYPELNEITKSISLEFLKQKIKLPKESKKQLPEDIQVIESIEDFKYLSSNTKSNENMVSEKIITSNEAKNMLNMQIEKTKKKSINPMILNTINIIEKLEKANGGNINLPTDLVLDFMYLNKQSDIKFKNFEAETEEVEIKINKKDFLKKANEARTILKNIDDNFYTKLGKNIKSKKDILNATKIIQLDIDNKVSLYNQTLKEEELSF